MFNFVKYILWIQLKFRDNSFVYFVVYFAGSPVLQQAYYSQLVQAPEYSSLSDILPVSLGFLSRSIASSSARTYSSPQLKYLKFVLGRHLRPFPLSDIVLVAWATVLTPSCSPGTIRQYISSVRSLSRASGYPLPKSWPPILSAFLAGFRRVFPGSSRVRLPITFAVLQQISRFIPLSDFNGSAFWALMCLATFGLFRLGEIVAISRGGSLSLCWGDVRWFSHNGQLALSVFLRHSKCDTAGQGVWVFVGASGRELCPITAMKRYWDLCKLFAPNLTLPGMPFFVFASGQPIIRGDVVRVLRSLLSAAGICPELFAGHSFRSGGATSLAAAGVPGRIIQSAGRWSSDAFKRYVRTSVSARIGWSRLIAQG